MNYSFKPRLIPTLITLVLLPILLKLGFWQLDRAQEKRELQAAFTARAMGEALSLSEINKDWQNFRYQKVQFTGTFDNERHLLLDNQTYQGQAGYHLITPVILENRQRILVNRGWIPLGENRQTLPVIEPVTDEIEILGIVNFVEENPFILKDIDETLAWPLRIQYINLDKLNADLGELLPFMILLQPDQPHGFIREWQVINIQPEKHEAYAFQWFALAVTLVIIFIIVNFRRREK